MTAQGIAYIGGIVLVWLAVFAAIIGLGYLVYKWLR